MDRRTGSGGFALWLPEEEAEHPPEGPERRDHDRGPAAPGAGRGGQASPAGDGHGQDREPAPLRGPAGGQRPLERRLMRALPVLPMVLRAAAGFAAAGCVSSQDIEGLHTQISSVQRQVVEMQTQAPSKQDVGNLEARMGRQMESLLKTEADMQVKLQNLSSHIDELQAKLEDTNNRLAQLSQQIATTNQELRSFRS